MLLLLPTLTLAIKVMTREEANEASPWPTLNSIWNTLDELGEEGPFGSNLIPILAHVKRHQVPWDLNETWSEIEHAYRNDLVSPDAMASALEIYPPHDQERMVRILRLLPKPLPKLKLNLSGWYLIEAQHLIHNAELPKLDENLKSLELHLRYAPDKEKVDLALQKLPKYPVDIPLMIGAIRDKDLLQYALEHLKDISPIAQLLLQLSLQE